MEKRLGLLIVGAGKGGKALLEILSPVKEINLIGVADLRKSAPGIKLAKKLGIPTSSNFREFLGNENLSIVIDATGNPQVARLLSRTKPVALRKIEIMGGTSAKLMWGLIKGVKDSEKQINEQVKSLVALSRLSLRISSILDLEKVLNLVVNQAIEILKADVCSLRLLDETGENLILVASLGHSKEYMEKKKILKLKESLAGLAALKKEPVVIPVVEKNSRYAYPQLAKEEKLCSLLSVPLLEKEKPIGVLNVYTRKKHIFTKEEKELLFLFASQAALAITNARLYEKLEGERRNLEEKVKKQTQKLLHQEKLAAIGQLASGIAHELKNPLGVIKGVTYYLRQILKTKEEKVFRHLEMIDKEVAISSRIINDLLEFSRVPKISLEPVKVNQVLEGTLELVEKPDKISLRKDFLSDLPQIEGDADRLRQVFSNLISNAYDAMPEGGKLTISTGIVTNQITALAGSPKFVEIRIQDSGCGIAKENLEKIFDPLFTTKSKGTGLGLAVCKGIIEAHKGEISVESELNKGTVFTVKLPLRRENQGIAGKIRE